VNSLGVGVPSENFIKARDLVIEARSLAAIYKAFDGKKPGKELNELLSRTDKWLADFEELIDNSPTRGKEIKGVPDTLSKELWEYSEKLHKLRVERSSNREKIAS
jgi:hypothetical protein